MKKIPKKVQEIRDFVAKMDIGSKSISFSQLSLYVSCPKKWYRTYVTKEAPYAPSIHTVFGTAVHETLQSWLGTMYNISVKESEAFDMNQMLLENMREVYRSDREILGKDYSTPQEMAEFYEDGVQILDFVRKHRKAYFSTKGIWLVGCEIPILYKLREGFYFKGFIDALFYDEILDRWKIVDFKTSTRGWKDEKSDFLKTSQVLLYKHFLAELFGINPEKIDVEYFIVKRKIIEDAEYPSMKKRVQEFEPSHGSRVTKRAVEMVNSFISGALTDTGHYQDREYEETPSESACKWCLFKDSCKSAIL